MSNPDVKFILTYIDHVLAPNVRVQDTKKRCRSQDGGTMHW